MEKVSAVKVSVIITSYNRGHFIADAIRSALNQNYPNLEVIITDNNSTDNTDIVVKEFLTDPRIVYSKNKTNIGMIPNFSKGIYELACGEYVTFLSCDDYFTDNNFISESILLMNKYPNVTLVFCKTGMVTSKNPNSIIDVVDTSLFKQEFYRGIDLFLKLANRLGLGFGGCLLHRQSALKNGIFKFDTPSADFHIILNCCCREIAHLLTRPFTRGVFMKPITAKIYRRNWNFLYLIILPIFIPLGPRTSYWMNPHYKNGKPLNLQDG
jgi:glycosyltransferase involved in cell wall biosynthesis